MDSKEIKKKLDKTDKRWEKLTKEFEEKLEKYKNLPHTEKRKAKLADLHKASLDAIDERVVLTKELAEARMDELKRKYKK